MTTRWTCPNCHRTFRLDSDAVRLPIFCACGFVDREGLGHISSVAEAPPPVIVQAATFLSAWQRWIAAGSPTRDDAEVDQIFRDYCRSCPDFDGNHTCTHCGCQVRDVSGEKASAIGRYVSRNLANKIRLGTEHCPVGKWS